MEPPEARGTIGGVRRLFRWVIGLASVLAVWRVWSRRRRPAAAEPAPDPADELRRKLAATRDDETAAPEERPPDESLDERRARVHAKANEAIESMREDEP